MQLQTRRASMQASRVDCKPLQHPASFHGLPMGDEEAWMSCSFVFKPGRVRQHLHQVCHGSADILHALLTHRLGMAELRFGWVILLRFGWVIVLESSLVLLLISRFHVPTRATTWILHMC